MSVLELVKFEVSVIHSREDVKSQIDDAGAQIRVGIITERFWKCWVRHSRFLSSRCP